MALPISLLYESGLKIGRIAKQLNESYGRIYGLYWDHIKNPGYNAPGHKHTCND